MARWQSGDAADCKSVYAGSIPTRASIILIALLQIRAFCLISFCNHYVISRVFIASSFISDTY